MIKKNALIFIIVFFVAEVFCSVAKQREINIISSFHNYDLNPQTASYTLEAQLLTGLYEGLFSYDPVTLEPVPALCVSYKISRDKKRWTFTLREDAKFSDGTPITAQTIKKSWILLLANPAAPFSSLIDCITGAAEFRAGKCSENDVRIDVRDEKTLVIHLNEPAAHLAKVLCHHSFSAVSTTKNVYSGAFTLESNDDENLVMKKNENYWDAQNVRIPKIKIKKSDDYVENSFLFNNGNVDWVMGNADTSKILNKDSICVTAEFGTVYLFFKIGNSPWDKAEFRNALLEAVPYDKLREKFSVKAETLIYPLAGYPQVPGINDFDSADAVYLMNLARDKYGIPKKEKIPLVFATTSEGYIKEWAQLLKDAWEPLGVELVTQSVSSERYNSLISTWNADLFYYSWVGDFADPLAFLELFRGNSSLNVANFKNDDFDAILLEAARSDSYSEQYQLFSKAEQILLDSGEIIPISHPISLHIINLYEIGGWQKNALDLHPLKYLYIKDAPKIFVPNLVKFKEFP